MFSVAFALLTALANGAASVLQRWAAVSVPQSKAFHLSLFGYLVRNKAWLAGIGLVIAAAVCQAVALATGPVARVQPIFIIELPFSLLLASRLAGRRLPSLTWGAVALVTVSLGVGLAAASPSGGSDRAPTEVWVVTLTLTALVEATLIVVGIRTHHNARAAALGLAAGIGYALTAALMKSAMATLAVGAGAFFTSWQFYGTVIAGIGALFLFQNSLQAGSLVVAQPPLTLGDALCSVAFGVGVYGEGIRTGGWLAVEVISVLLIGVGCVELSRSLARLQLKAAEPERPARHPISTDVANCPDG